MNRHSHAGERPRVSRRRVLAASGAIGAGLLAGCSGTGDGGGSSSSDSSDGDTTDGGNSGDDMDSEDGSGGGADEGSMDDGSGEGGESVDADAVWRTTELTDVLTEETFSIDRLDGPVAIQAFAVWCPKCERQSRALASVDESVTVVSLNIDPNEDAAKVREHAEGNGFDWRFAVAPTEMTESLVEAFGTAITNAPSTPIIVDCGDGTTEFFSGSQQSAQTIESTASEC
jgi:thiol-disulfide isomerase/thioredoxin